MQNLHSELCKASMDDVRIESAADAHSIRYWLRALDDKWFRLRPTEKDADHEHDYSSIGAEATGYSTRSFLGNLLPSQVRMPGKKRGSWQPVDQVVVKESGLLVWKPLHGEETWENICTEFGIVPEAIRQFRNGMRFLLNAVRPSSHREEQVKKWAQEITQNLGKYGRVVGELNPAAKERLCVAIKMDHGNLETLFDALIAPEYRRLYMEHQSAIYRLCMMIMQAIGLENMMIFPEGVSRDRSESEPIFRSFQNNAPNFLKEAETFDRMESDDAERVRIFSLLRRWAGTGRKEDAANFFSFFCQGESAFINRLVAKKELPLEKIHGIALPKGVPSPATMNFQGLTAEQIQSHSRMHISAQNKFLIESIAEKVPDGKVGLSIIGGAHFSSGPYGNQVIYPGGMVEDYVRTSQALQNTRVIIIEPLHFQELPAVGFAAHQKRRGK